MQINKTIENDKLTVALEGRLDTLTAPQLDAEIQGKLDGVKSLVFDFKKLDYISSAGLRILLMAQKVMNKQGTMVVKNDSSEIKEIFEVTGFCDILTIEYLIRGVQARKTYPRPLVGDFLLSGRVDAFYAYNYIYA